MSDEELRDLLDLAAGEPGEPPTARLLAALHRRRRKRALHGSAVTAVLAAGALIVVAAPWGTAERTPSPQAKATGPSLQLAADVTPYASCDALLSDLVTRALPSVGAYGIAGNASYATAAVPGPQGLSRTYSGMQGALTSGTATAATTGGADQVAAPHSSTTDRTRGVDEPDITKTDGKLFLSLRQGVLRVYDALAPKQLGQVTITTPYGSEPQLLLAGSTAVVTGLAPSVQQLGAAHDTSVVETVDLSDPANPVVARKLSVDGDVLDARLVNGLPRLVLHVAAPQLKWFSPTGSDAQAQAVATQDNQQLLKQSTIDDWLPTYALTDGSGKDLGHGRIFDCDQVDRSSDASDGADLVGVTAFDPAATTGLEGGLAVVGAGTTAYATDSHLWLATGRNGGGFAGCGYDSVVPEPYACPLSDVRASGTAGTTQLHGFDITDPKHTTGLGSATLAGSLHGDDAINEQDGTLSVIVSQAGQGSTLVDFTEKAGTLTRVGSLGALSTGETVQSVRWIGTLCFLVTYRQVDPLLVIDISAPATPKLRASLPSADTSTYLLMSDTDRLVGVGNGPGGTVVKLYGVDDPDHPKLLATQTVPGGGTGAATDPHELLYWRAGRLLFLPTYDGNVRVLDVGRDTLSLRLELKQGGHTGTGSSAVDRAVLIGHDAWTVSDRGVLVSNLAGGADVAWLPSS